MKTKRFNVRVSEKEKENLDEISEKLGIPQAIIVRQAVKKEIVELVKQIPKIQPETETALAQ